MSPTPCDLHALVDRHFTGRIRPDDERRMREHLPGCASCTGYYERHLLLARLDPKAPDARTRLARGLGLDAPEPRAPSRMAQGAGMDAREPWAPWRLARGLGLKARELQAPWRLAWVPAAVACLAILWVRVPGLLSGGTVPETGFTSRGVSPARLVDGPLVVYTVEPGGGTAPVGATVRPSQELAFAYRNPDGRRFLMVFARDAGGQVYWYHPSWTDEASNPVAIPSLPGERLHELPEAISHPLKPGPLTVYGVFLDAPMTVRELEARLSRARRVEDALPPGAGATSLELQVVP